MAEFLDIIKSICSFVEWMIKGFVGMPSCMHYVIRLHHRFSTASMGSVQLPRLVCISKSLAFKIIIKFRRFGVGNLFTASSDKSFRHINLQVENNLSITRGGMMTFSFRALIHHPLEVSSFNHPFRRLRLLRVSLKDLMTV